MHYPVAALPRFQFTLRGMLLATFWTALWLAIGAAPHESARSDALLHCVMALQVVLPFVAIGALLGRTGMGAIAGFVAIACLAAAIYLRIDNGLTYEPFPYLQFTLRDVLWLSVVVALGLGWARSHRSLLRHRNALRDKLIARECQPPLGK